MDTSDADPMVARRGLIDLIAETRSRSVRVALFGALVHRPDPDGVETDAERDAHLRVLQDTVRWISRVADLMRTGTDPWGEIPREACDWLTEFVSANREVARKVERMAELSGQVAQAAAKRPFNLGISLRAHYDFRRDGFMDLITAFCDGMWASIDAERAEAVSSAARTARTVQSAMDRLETIGRHVRFVSLNASIEATHIGAGGKGIGVIANEFKNLSEEIQALAISARKDVAAIVGDARVRTRTRP